MVVVYEQEIISLKVTSQHADDDLISTDHQFLIGYC